MHKIEFHAMGTQILAAVDNDEPRVGAALEQVPVWFEEWEQALSRFRPDSELSQLNQSAGRPFRASPLLWDMLDLALEAKRLSQGLVTPALLPALERAGYTQTFDQVIAGPIAYQVEAPNADPDVTDVSLIQLDRSAGSIQLPMGMRLDFGGVAKGWAADQAMQRLQPLGAALVDAGGDIAVCVPEGEAGWPIQVNDPTLPTRALEDILVANGGVATSGQDRRRWQKNGHWQHHIIDPRSGQPAETDVLAATVVAPTVMEAEMAAKSMLILGSQAGLDWLEESGHGQGLVLLTNGDAIYSNHFENYIRKSQ